MDVVPPQSKRDVGEDKSRFVAAIVPGSIAQNPVQRMVPHHRLQGIGKLDLPASALALVGEYVKHLGNQNIATDYGKVRGRCFRLRLLNNASRTDQVSVLLGHVQDAVSGRKGTRNPFDGQ